MRQLVSGSGLDRVPKLGCGPPMPSRRSATSIIDHKEYIGRYGDDIPEITGWRWGQEAASAGGGTFDGGRQRLTCWREAKGACSRSGPVWPRGVSVVSVTRTVQAMRLSKDVLCNRRATHAAAG